MNTKKKLRHEAKLTRRTLLQGLGAATLLAGTVPAGCSWASSVGQAKAIAPATLPDGVEHCDVYKYLAVWLILSTNADFADTTKITNDQIQAATGVGSDVIRQARASVTEARLQVARGVYNDLLKKLNVTYKPPDCPHVHTTMAAIATLPKPSNCQP